ncbi:GMC oxidoreductase [Sphaerobolus stellatus SS14]|nr:GMC oxidoreductase [Sphaerobolus stellatus SS14]
MGVLFSSPFISNPAKYAIKVQEDSELDSSSIPSYDYVIVGGGAAACVLAHRLTEDFAVTVLMIEAGEDRSNSLLHQAPALWTKTFKTPGDWGFVTTPQPGLSGRSDYWPAGKGIGGSSTISAMMYQRPCADDINEWVGLGAAGWGWEEVLKYLNKAEKYTLHPSKPNEFASHRGSDGFWKTRHLDHLPIAERYLDACDKIGIRKIDDINGPNGPLGATFVSAFVDNNIERSSVANAYLTKEVLKRPNLEVATQTYVTRIITEPIVSSGEFSHKAIGVELAKSADSPVFRVNAKREVLCCAGAVMTPQILTASGIGPTSELERLKITVVKPLEAVGQNLYDHPCIPVAFKAKPGSTFDFLNQSFYSLKALLQYLLFRRGPLTMLVGQSFAFIKSTDTSLPVDKDPSQPVKLQDATSGMASPDLEIIGVPIAFRNHGFIPGPAGDSVFTIASVLLRPLSHGSITLKSSNIWDGANIDPRYFSHENDMKVLVKSVRLSLRIARASSLADQLLLTNDKYDVEDWYHPGHTDPDEVTDEELAEFIRRHSQTLYHPMGTARMGQSPTDSVVNPQLRVHGIANLRVIDASIFPAPLAGHTSAAVIAVAEKASDIIKADQ